VRVNRWTLRRWAKRTLVSTASRRSFDGTGRVVVLCYHSVHPHGSIATATPGLFDEHLAWLKENCDVIAFSQVVRHLDRPAGTRPTVSITFDDGYADNHEFAFPLLKKWRLPASFFVTTGLLERDSRVLARFRSFYGASFDEISPMGWGQLLELSQDGMEVGAHTYSHPNLARLGAEELRAELTSSKAIMEDRLERPVDTMAYPFGLPRAHVNRRVVDAVRRAGYESAASILYRDVRSGDAPHTIPRFFVKQDDAESLRLKVLGAFDVVAVWQTRAPLALGRLLTPDYFGSGDWVRAR
jgi:peptidoglycan/xylan/chitin deacetylase (PgdA/CDA1 family)